MPKKIFWIENSGRIKASFSESSVRVNVDVKSFVSTLESEYEIVGVYFEKYRIGFMLREKQ